MIITRSGTCLCRRGGAGRGERRCSRALERGRRRGWASGQGRGGAGCCRKRIRGPEVGPSRQCGSRSGLVRGLLASCWDGERSCTCSRRLHPASGFGAAPAPSRGAAVPPSWSAGWADVVGTGDGRGGLGWEGARPWRRWGPGGGGGVWKWLRLPVLFTLRPPGPHAAPTSRRSPGDHQGVWSGNLLEETPWVPLLFQAAISHLLQRPYPFLSCFPPPHPVCGDTSPYPSSAPLRLR